MNTLSMDKSFCKWTCARIAKAPNLRSPWPTYSLRRILGPFGHPFSSPLVSSLAVTLVSLNDAGSGFASVNSQDIEVETRWKLELCRVPE